MEKSANKLWKESGTTLSFKEWITRENQKKEEVEQKTFLPFEGEKQVQDTIKYTLEGGSVPDSVRVNTVFGLNKSVLILSGVLIAGSLGFYFYKRLKKRQ